ncbi:MAG TPA: tetratricopeptide repeat protein [Pyrinomonadaceae bacterium]|nr:tetratricopeptide repeat protein [Pyrinomonadaceae bacterium]
MSKSRTVSLALAIILAAVCAPRVALGNRVLYAPAPDAPTTASDASHATPPAADATDDAQQPKHKESGLARLLAAPFRALAKLFGGTKKSEEAKKSAPRPSTTTDASADKSEAGGESNTSEVKPSAATQSANAQGPKTTTPAEQEATEITRGVASGTQQTVASGAQQTEAVRVIRPDANGVLAEKPRMWIPVIEGISKDPLTQGRALLEHGYLQEALAELSVAATVGPDFAEANNLLGVAYDRTGQHLQAAECYQRALTVAPKNVAVLANLGYSLYLADDYEGALKRLKQAAKLAPGTPVIYDNLGIVYARLRRYDDAFKYFAIASNEYDAHLKLASVLEDQKRDRDAIKHYEAALRMQPGTSAVLERLVALYERAGEHDKAEQARRTLGQPKNPQKTTTGGGG